MARVLLGCLHLFPRVILQVEHVSKVGLTESRRTNHHQFILTRCNMSNVRHLRRKIGDSLPRGSFKCHHIAATAHVELPVAPAHASLRTPGIFQQVIDHVFPLPRGNLEHLGSSLEAALHLGAVASDDVELAMSENRLALVTLSRHVRQ
ncbi:hypothetical protein OIU74_012249 [Salix koriyanagi]|uniref:Secreted protein n=1 Tax=Salix koriyanagi TaxID=2511006 RepID=A0A9Q0T535_9ROSI|nr:hypothetical protein OIU74_012249 [Salix koriyanagi]